MRQEAGSKRYEFALILLPASCFMLLAQFAPTNGYSAERMQMKRPVSTAIQGKQKKDKPREWVFYKNGKVYKREWDRNHDGKPDLRIYERSGRVISKQYDDNFDGKFERIVPSPDKGKSGKTATTIQTQK